MGKNLPTQCPLFEGDCVLRFSKTLWCFGWLRSNWIVFLFGLLQFKSVATYDIKETLLIDT